MIPVLGIVVFVFVCQVVAHGCHSGGHELDVEPALALPSERTPAERPHPDSPRS